MAIDFAVARENMVESQLKPNQVKSDLIVEIMGITPRELFVDPRVMSLAYLDDDIMMAPNRYLLEPMVTGKMLELAQINASHEVLIIGAGTGYVVALVSHLAKVVVGLEEDEKLMSKANDLLTELGCNNTVMVLGALTQGWAKEAPFDIILIDGAVDVVPKELYAQLRPGGKLITVVQDAEDLIGTITVFTASLEKLGIMEKEEHHQVFTKRLHDFDEKVGFTF